MMEDMSEHGEQGQPLIWLWKVFAKGNLKVIGMIKSSSQFMYSQAVA